MFSAILVSSLKGYVGRGWTLLCCRENMKNFSPYVLCKRFMLRHVKVEVDSLSAGHESLRLEEEYKVGSCDEWCAYSCQFLIETACHTDRRDELSTWFITSCFSKKQKAISINCHARQKKIFSSDSSSAKANEVGQTRARLREIIFALSSEL